jgi:hypothetical protein
VAGKLLDEIQQWTFVHWLSTAMLPNKNQVALKRSCTGFHVVTAGTCRRTQQKQCNIPDSWSWPYSPCPPMCKTAGLLSRRDLVNSSMVAFECKFFVNAIILESNMYLSSLLRSNGDCKGAQRGELNPYVQQIRVCGDVEVSPRGYLHRMASSKRLQYPFRGLASL